MIEVGTLVRLVNLDDPSGGNYLDTPANTVGNEGTVRSVRDSWFDVEWNNGEGDCYVGTNLEIITELTLTSAEASGDSTPETSVEMCKVLANQYCVPEGVYEMVAHGSNIITIKNSEGQVLQMPTHCLGSTLIPNKSPDEIINEHLDTVTTDRPERSMVEYSLSINRGLLEKVNNPPEFPNRDWTKSNNKDEEVITRLRVKGFSVHSIAQASGLSYESVLEITNRILKPE